MSVEYIKKLNQIQEKSLFLERSLALLARVFHLSMSLLMKYLSKTMKLEKKIKFLKCSLAHINILHLIPEA